MPTPAQQGYATVNGHLLGTARCKWADPSQLIASAPRRGENRLLPLARDRRRYERRPDEKVVQILLRINGWLTEDGAATGGGIDGAAEAAENYLEGLAAEDEDGGVLGVGLEEVPFVWFRRDGTTRTGDVQVHGVFSPVYLAGGTRINAVLEMAVPSYLAPG